MRASEPLSPVEVAQIERQYSEDEAHMCVPRLIATLRAVERDLEAKCRCSCKPCSYCDEAQP